MRGCQPCHAPGEDGKFHPWWGGVPPCGDMGDSEGLPTKNHSLCGEALCLHALRSFATLILRLCPAVFIPPSVTRFHGILRDTAGSVPKGSG